MKKLMTVILLVLSLLLLSACGEEPYAATRNNSSHGGGAHTTTTAAPNRPGDTTTAAPPEETPAEQAPAEEGSKAPAEAATQKPAPSAEPAREARIAALDLTLTNILQDGSKTVENYPEYMIFEYDDLGRISVMHVLDLSNDGKVRRASGEPLYDTVFIEYDGDRIRSGLYYSDYGNAGEVMTGSFINLYNERGLLESETAYGCGYLLRGTDMVDLTALARSMSQMGDQDWTPDAFYIRRAYTYDGSGRIETRETVRSSSGDFHYYEYPSGGGCLIRNNDDELVYDQLFTKTGKLFTNTYYIPDSDTAAIYSYQYDYEDRITEYKAAFYDDDLNPRGNSITYDYVYVMD